jgi:hypothetical protein
MPKTYSAMNINQSQQIFLNLGKRFSKMSVRLLEKLRASNIYQTRAKNMQLAYKAAHAEHIDARKLPTSCLTFGQA